MSGADDVHARTHLQNLSAYREADALRAGDIGGMSQEEILDLIVAATIGQEEPLDDEPADGDYRDPDDLLDLRRDGANPPRAPAGGSVSPGWGFASDGILDGLVPGPALAGLADTAHSRGLHLVSDDELTGIIRAWRRITSWATARELAAIAELARRRPADDTDFGLQIKARLRAAGAAGAAEEDKARERCSGDGASAVGERECSAGSAPADGGPVGLPGGSGKPGGEPPRAAETERSPDETPGPDDAGIPALISPFVSDELAAALTLTVRAAETHLEFATELASKLLMTAAALEAGVIDPVRAKIIADAAHVLTNEQAAAVEDLILPRAGQQTSGQLWAALARAILAVDPDAARRRREEAQRDARVMRWREDAGTAALCGRDLPSTDVLAADQRISARARELKSAGIAGTMDELRARAYLDFLLGRSAMPEGSAGDCQAVSPSSGGSTSAGRGAAARADGTATGLEATAGPAGGLAAQINVTVPLSAILGLSEAPAEVAAFGPVDAPLARDLVRAAGIHPATRWCATVVGQNGQAVGHGCARGRYTAPAAPAAPFPGNHDLPGGADDGLSSAGDNGRPGDNRRNRDGPRGSTSAPEPQLHALSVRAREFMQRLGIRVTPLAVATCDHRNEEPGYKPSRRLRHLTGARTARCTAPGCRRPAVQCDFDHTIASEAGGRTCECNLGPLCRRHHRCKQAQGWALEQPSPGIMIWTTPAGRRYTTRPTSYYI